MKLEKLTKYLDEFYKIREDNVAHIYLERFIIMVAEDNVEPPHFEQYLKLNSKSIWNGVRKTTKKRYSGVLKQYIRYVVAVEGISVYKKKKPPVQSKKHERKSSRKHSSPRVVSQGRGSVKIHNTFYDFVKSNQ